MERNFSRFGNQDGSLSLIVLLIMATLAIAGLMVTKDAVTESCVVRNYAIHKQRVAAAEAAGKELIQAIDSIFTSNSSASGAVKALDGKSWKPYDDYNTTFDFDDAQWGSYNLKSSNVSSIGYLTSADAIAVLVDQTTSAMNPGLGGAKVPEYYTYVVYCGAEHVGADTSEVILMIGYRQEKI